MNFGESVMYLFKERRWWLKFGIIFLISYCFTAISIVFSAISDNTVTTNASPIENMPVLLTSLALSLVVILILLFFSTFYTYENTQAGINNRPTKLLWEYSFKDVIKKVAKYSIVNFVYAIIITVTFLVVIGLPAIWIGLMVNSAYSSDPSSATLAGLVAIGFLFSCIILAIILVLSAIFFALSSAGILRLIATNTFSEAFKFKSNIRIGKKYFWNFFLVFVLLAGVSIIYSILSIISSSIAATIFFKNDLFQIITQLIFEIPLSAFLVFFSYFVYTRLLGKVYRGIIAKEEELKSLR